MEPRAISQAVRELAEQSLAEQSKTAIQKYADDLSLSVLALRSVVELVESADRWYNNNDLAAEVAALGSSDFVPGTKYTKTQILAIHIMKNSFLTWLEDEMDTIFMVVPEITIDEDA
jgi:hypothetical protein